jgi:hypothetical protein
LEYTILRRVKRRIVRMKSRRIILLAGLSIALALAGLVAACGGCGGGGGGTTADGGIGGTGISVGAISGFGSIYVNGVEFETSTATISIDDDPGDESDLKLGQVVRVEGQFGDDGISGTATSVIYDDNLKGPIDTINVGARTMVVFGVPVTWNANTRFHEDDSSDTSIDPSDLEIDDIVEVSGTVDLGSILATRIERKTGVFEFEIKGLVDGPPTATLFTLSPAPAVSVTVDYTGIVVDNGPLADGLFVEVKSSVGFSDSAGAIIASSVEVEETGIGGNDGDLAEIEGVILEVTSSNPPVVEFTIGLQEVITNSGTELRPVGAAFADIVVGADVEVDGTIQGGVLVAREVEFEVEDDARIEAFVEAIDTTSNVLTALGISVSYSDTTSVTEFEDKSEGADPFTDINIDAIAPTSDWLRIEATIDSSGNLFASRIERDNDTDDTRVILKGPAKDVPVSPGPFTILGVNVVEGTGVEYRLGEDTPIDRTTFFNNLSNGRPVKARGSYLSGTLTAERLELDD